MHTPIEEIEFDSKLISYTVHPFNIVTKSIELISITNLEGEELSLDPYDLLLLEKELYEFLKPF